MITGGTGSEWTTASHQYVGVYTKYSTWDGGQRKFAVDIPHAEQAGSDDGGQG